MDDPKLIAALVGLIVELTLLVKVYRDLIAVKADRTETKISRDQAELQIRDTVQKLTWENARLKEDMTFMKTGLDDHQLQLSTLNTELAKVSTKLDSALEILHDLKEARQ
jgi:predicted  nucleic acid-binding Zn-ribbon protein